MKEKPAHQKKDGLRVLFPTLIYEAWYPAFEAEKEKLTAFNQDLRAGDKEGQAYSAEHYPNGFTSYFSRNDLYKLEELAALVTFLYRCAHSYASQHHWNLDDYEPVINSLWGNINPRNSFHAEHLHPYCHISGVFYVKFDPGSPAISFKDPRMGRWMMPPAADGNRPENTFQANVTPEAGKLLMFPSWLEHGVPQNQTDTDRISMPFNFEMRAKSANK